MGVSRNKDGANWLVYVKMLVYTKTHVVVPSFLFTVATATRVILMLLTFLRFTSFLSFCINLEQGLHEGPTLIALKLLVGLLELGGLTCGLPVGLTILVKNTPLQPQEASLR
jgi:hypothetical protein